MNSEMLEDILACPSLPTLPAVALKVIELCSDPNVRFSELAKTIQNDQGLAAKVLRTVNSSFYGLRQRCGSIDKALIMLGLSPVKALVLGFSLVSSLEGNGGGFDYKDYWRRGLYTAVGGKCMVESAGMKYGDEVFLAGLLQDIGVMALHRAMGADYLAVMQQTNGDHRRLVKAELSALEVQHPDIGAMLAQRWKLPDTLVIPVKYHERPTAAPAQHTEIVHGVGLGNLVHDAIVGAEPADALRKLYERAGQWLNLTTDKIDLAIKRSKEATRELAGLFKLDIGVDMEARAQAVLTQQASKPSEDGPTPAAGAELLLIDPTDLDKNTGMVGRKGYEWALRRAFLFAGEHTESASLVQITLDPSAAVSTLTADGPRLMGLLRKHFMQTGAALCKLSDRIFAVVTVGTANREVDALVEELRKSMSAPPASKIFTGTIHFGEGAAAKYVDPTDIVRGAIAAINTARSQDAQGKSAA